MLSLFLLVDVNDDEQNPFSREERPLKRVLSKRLWNVIEPLKLYVRDISK